MDDSFKMPLRLLTEVEANFPNAWKLAEEFRAGRGKKGLPNWPEWCFLPMAAAVAISSSNPRAGISDWPAMIAAATVWRMGQGIYRFDETLYQEIIETPLDGDIPSEVLHHLPEWGIYVPTPGMADGIAGFFAHLEFDVNRAEKGEPAEELRLLAVASNEYMPIPLHLVGNLDKAIEASMAECIRNLGKLKLLEKDHLPSAEIQHLFDSDLPKRLKRISQKLLPLVLYLCSAGMDVKDSAGSPRLPRHAQSTKTKRGLRFFPPARPSAWDVGYRIGAALRAARAQERIEKPAERAPGTHASPIPHLRRAHFHTFLFGPRGGERSARVRWLPPIPVNMDWETPGIPTIHKVS